MRVLFASRKSIFKVKGGDTIQLLNTANELRKLGVEIEVYEGQVIDWSKYDLIHFFNLIRPAEILELTSKCELPYVVSTIYVDYGFYNKINTSMIYSTILAIFGKNGLEYFKALVKHILGKEKQSYWKYFLLGHRRSIKKVLQGASHLLPNSNSEYERLQKDYSIKQDYSAIVNGVNTALFNYEGEALREEKLVLCVGQIEPRKNQLKLIEAIKDSDYRLIIVGKVALNHLEYYEKCKALANERVEIINNALAQKDLIQYYKQAKVHVLASWFETTGLSSLEAAAMGCNIVVTKKGDTQDYFKDFAEYCDPSSSGSILSAITKAMKIENTILRNYVKKNFTWENAAKQTLVAYKKVLE